ncbi:MAG: hypothetical protein OXU25_04440 [Thaumarchaeota archaeon]|nr:hypothetical protein [Nitrososphaerota archaeon]
MARVNSRGAKHGTTMARQQAVRKRPASRGPEGEPRARPERQAAGLSRTRFRTVTVVDWDGDKCQTRYDLARKMIKSGEIPLQEIR